MKFKIITILIFMFSMLTNSAIARDSLNVSVANWMKFGGGFNPAHYENHIYLTGEDYKGSSSLIALDIEDLNDVEEVYRKHYPFIGMKLSVAKDAFLACCYDDGVLVFSLEDPSDPEFISYLELENDEEIVCSVFGDEILFIGTRNRMIHAIDVSNGEDIEIVDSIQLDGIPKFLRFNDAYLFAQNYDFVRINVANPEEMYVVDEIDVRADDVAVSENLAILNVAQSGYYLIDLSDEETMEEMAFHEVRTQNQLFISNDTLFIYYEEWEYVGSADYEPLYDWVPYGRCVDISDPQSPQDLITFDFNWDTNRYYYLADGILVFTQNSSPRNRFRYKTLINDDRNVLYDFPFTTDGIIVYRDKLLQGAANGILIHSLDDPALPSVEQFVKLDLQTSAFKQTGSYLSAYHYRPGNRTYKFSVFDLSDGYEEFTTYEHPDFFNALTVDRFGYAYFISDDTLFCYDATDFDEAEIISRTYVGVGGSCTVYQDDYLIITGGIWGIKLLDISDKEHPELIHHAEFESGPNEVAIFGSLGLLVDDDFKVLDLSNPLEPEVLSSLEIPHVTYKIAVHDSVAVVATYDDYRNHEDPIGIHLIDFSDISNPEVVAYYTFDLHHEVRELTIEPPYIYATAVGYDPIFYCPEYLNIDQPPQILLPNLQSLSAYPNPFNATTNVTFALPHAGSFALDLFDMNGRRLMEVSHGTGVQQQLFNLPVDANDLPSGTYLLQLDNEGAKSNYPVTLIK